MMDRDQFEERLDGRGEQAEGKIAGKDAVEDARVEQALANFRANIRAWSDAAHSRPRAVELTVRHWSWRLAAGWALGCVLVAGTVTGGLMEHQRQVEAARIAAQQARQQQLAEAQERARQKERNLMATVDYDVSQQVPTAMEPLAQMMEVGGTQ